MHHRYIGDKAFYRRVFGVAVPIIIQNGITNFVSLLDNIMVGQVGTVPMSGVSIVNGLLFVFNPVSYTHLECGHPGVSAWRRKRRSVPPVRGRG